MKAKKIIMTEKEIDVEIIDITLLSIEEYLFCQNIIPLANDLYWLRSPGYTNECATRICCDGYIDCIGGFVDCVYAVRPALIFKSSNLNIGDKINLLGYKWTVINDNMIFCDNIIDDTYFRKNFEADNANNYEKSDIKKFLHNWLKNQMKN